jgi:stage II sporulation protein D
MGVLAGEIPQGWPLEALKAQALAARTFAVLKQTEARRRQAPYDLENTHLYQMYQGTEKITPAVRQAVLLTAGEALFHQGAPIQAFFHSNCGGKTTGAGNVWTKDQPYLRPSDCPFCSAGPHALWKREVPLEEVARKVRAAGVPAAEVLEMRVLDRDDSGRVKFLAFKDEHWSEHRMKGAAFRMALGTDVIKSTRFDLGVRDGKAYFSGRGWGHGVGGVGLCQEGALGMALKGHRSGEIIRRYYRGVTVEKLQ